MLLIKSASGVPSFRYIVKQNEVCFISHCKRVIFAELNFLVLCFTGATASWIGQEVIALLDSRRCFGGLAGETC